MPGLPRSRLLTLYVLPLSNVPRLWEGPAKVLGLYRRKHDLSEVRVHRPRAAQEGLVLGYVCPLPFLQRLKAEPLSDLWRFEIRDGQLHGVSRAGARRAVLTLRRHAENKMPPLQWRRAL